MKWFYNLSKNARILITVAAWVLAVGLIGGIGSDAAAVIGLVPLVAAIVFTVWTVKAGKQEKGTSSADECAEKYGILATFEISFLYGVYDRNKDGSDRQTLIKSAAPGDEVIIKAAPTSEYPLSFGAFNKNGKQLGALPPKYVKSLMTEYGGRIYSASVASLKSNNIIIAVTVYNTPPKGKVYAPEEWDRVVKDNEIVYIVKNGKVFHSDPSCFNNDEYSIITVKKARKRGLSPCKKCYRGYKE